MNAPETIETDRLFFRRPNITDAKELFERFANDSDVTRFVGWPRHESIDDTRTFLKFSDEEWLRWPAGPYLIFEKHDEVLIGSTGLAFESKTRAATGYVLAKNYWGKGIATESLRIMVDVAAQTGVERLFALCYPEHRASYRVMEKCGFEREGVLRRYFEFPNLAPGVLSDVLCYSIILTCPNS